MEDFFGSLPSDDFFPAEERLRECLLEVVDQGTHVPLPFHDAHVLTAARDLLPDSVTIEDWISERIGEELTIMPSWQDPSKQVCRRKNFESAGGSSGKKQQESEFLASLPEDEFTEAEERLRDAIFRALVSRIDAGEVEPDLGMLAQDRGVQGSKRTFLAEQKRTEVGFKAWIEARMGAELEITQRWRGSGPGTTTVRVTSAGEIELAPFREERGNGKGKDKHRDDAKGKGKDEGKDKGKDKGHDKGKGKDRPREDATKGKGKEKGKSKKGKDLSPEEEDRRQRDLDQREQQTEDFFASLPDDDFTQQEEDMRSVLLDFLSAWKEREPPSLSTAGSDDRVRIARAALLPRCSSLTQWIRRRVGGEIETVQGEGAIKETFFGLRGKDSERLAKAAEDSLRHVSKTALSRTNRGSDGDRSAKRSRT